MKNKIDLNSLKSENANRIQAMIPGVFFPEDSEKQMVVFESLVIFRKALKREFLAELDKQINTLKTFLE